MLVSLEVLGFCVCWILAMISYNYIVTLTLTKVIIGLANYVCALVAFGSNRVV